MPEPFLRVHPLCRERNSRNRRIRAKTAFKRIPTVRKTNLKGQLRVDLTGSPQRLAMTGIALSGRLEAP
jgi:hypothetical protein